MDTDEPLLVPHLDELNLNGGLESIESEDLYAEVLESICGIADDSQPVEQYNGSLGVTTAFVNANQSMVAQVQWNTSLPYSNPGNVAGVRWGTGTMISPDLFLTAGHLFDQTGGGWNRPRVNGTTNIISPQEIATNMHLNFNYQVDPSGTLRAEQSFAITQLVEYRLGGVDFAVCRIAGSPGNTFGFSPVATADAAVGDMLCIMGHPAGVPKRIEAGPLVSFSGNTVLYNDIDTLGGNSGSGILRASTGQLVGVHTNGGCNASGTGSNYGMRITAIRTNSPTVRNLNLFATLSLADRIGTSLIQDLGLATSSTKDLLRTTAFSDNPTLATTVLRDLRTDVTRDNPIATGPGGDRPFGWDLVGPVVNPAIVNGPAVRPFVLATPHHSPVLPDEQQAAEGTPEEYASVLAALEQSIEAQQAELAATAEQYDAVRAEYEAQFGG